MAVEVFEMPSFVDGERLFEVNVPTERGTTCVVEVFYYFQREVFGIEWSRELFDQAPEALTATVQVAMLGLREHLAARS